MVQWNILFTLFLALFAASALSRWALTRVNVDHLKRHGREVPETFRGEIDGETLSRMTSYTAESSRLSSLESLFDDAVLLAVLFAGLLPWLVRVLEGWNPHPVWAGMLFFAFLYAAGTLLDIPFSLYRVFVIEKKYGFSTITPSLWVTDLLKGFLIALVILFLLFTPLLALIFYAGRGWWVWAWVFFAAFQLVVTWLYPIFIAPLFNKYEPIRSDDLRQQILALMGKAGLRAEGIYQIDAGKRSRHSNAYFTGIGKTKRIVLFDTLIDSHGADEIISVLAHEIGHWKKRHVLKQLLFVEVLSFLVFYLMSEMITWPLIYSTFGFERVTPYAGILLAVIVMKPVAFFLSPAAAVISRTFERDADRFTYELVGSTQALRNALKRLAKDNLANLHPHPFYVWFYYSHPPLTERIERLESMETAKGS